MELSVKIAMLEFRLHRLQARERNNAGVCRRVERALKALRSLAPQSASLTARQREEHL